MNTKIYAFILGLVLSTAVFTLISFKNSEKAVEKEYVIIAAEGYGLLVKSNYKILISTEDKYESIDIGDNRDRLNYVALVKKIKEYEKAGWTITNSNMTYTGTGHPVIYYSLEKDKQ